MKETWTVREMVATGACYSAERIAELWAEREALTLRDILVLNIPAQDRLWACWRLLTTTQRVMVINRIVRRAVETFARPEPSTTVWARRWLDGDANARTTVEVVEAAEADRQIADVLAVLDEASEQPRVGTKGIEA